MSVFVPVAVSVINSNPALRRNGFAPKPDPVDEDKEIEIEVDLGLLFFMLMCVWGVVMAVVVVYNQFNIHTAVI